jgi:hypothetical protein
MHRLRSTRSLGRFLAVWLLAWFVAMSFTARAHDSEASVAAACVVPAVSGGAGDNVNPAHAGHGGHAGQAAHEAHPDHHANAESAGGGCGAGHLAHDAHLGHASGSSGHCPLCLHAAVPPPPQFLQAVSEAPPDEVPVAAPGIHPSVRTDVPPPARAPPLFS